MKGLSVTLLYCLLTLSALAEKPSPPAERDYSFMTAEPYKAEIRLGQKRLAKFLGRLNVPRRTLLDKTPYVAVQVYELTAGEIPNLTYRLGKGSVASSQFTNDLRSGSQVAVKFLLLFDSRTQQLAMNDGVLVTDTPPLNSIGLFEGMHAVYVGTGW